MIRAHSRPHRSEVLLERSAVDCCVLDYRQGAENAARVEGGGGRVEATGTKSAAGSTGADEVVLMTGSGSEPAGTKSVGMVLPRGALARGVLAKAALAASSASSSCTAAIALVVYVSCY